MFPVEALLYFDICIRSRRGSKQHLCVRFFLFCFFISSYRGFVWFHFRPAQGRIDPPPGGLSQELIRVRDRSNSSCPIASWYTCMHASMLVEGEPSDADAASHNSHACTVKGEKLRSSLSDKPADQDVSKILGTRYELPMHACSIRAKPITDHIYTNRHNRNTAS
jgi:hypothetical protein